MIFSRVLAGVGSSVFSTMISGVLVDMYDKEDRNTPMAIFAGGTLFGTGFGPVPSGALVQYLGWRWIWYVQIILVGVTVSIMFATYRETRGSILLSRKAAALNRWYDEVERVMGEKQGEKAEDGGGAGMHTTNVQGEKAERVRWKVKDDEKKSSIWAMVKLSLVGPFHLLLTESVVFWFSACSGGARFPRPIGSCPFCPREPLRSESIALIWRYLTTSPTFIAIARAAPMPRKASREMSRVEWYRSLRTKCSRD